MTSALYNHYLQACSLFKILTEHPVYTNLVLGTKDRETKDTITGLEVRNKENQTGTSLVVQRLRLHAPNAGGRGSIPGQGTRSCMPQLKDTARHNVKIPHAMTKIPRAATKTQHSQINKY